MELLLCTATPPEGSGQCNSCNALPHCQGAVGCGTPAIHCLTAWCGVVWCGVVWCGVVWCGVVWCGVVWCGVVWCGVVWCGVVWCGVVWCGVVWCGVVWCGVTWCDVVWCAVVCCGVVWCGVVWCGVVWCGVVATQTATQSLPWDRYLRIHLRWPPMGSPRKTPLPLPFCGQVIVSCPPAETLPTPDMELEMPTPAPPKERLLHMPPSPAKSSKAPKKAAKKTTTPRQPPKAAPKAAPPSAPSSTKAQAPPKPAAAKKPAEELQPPPAPRAPKPDEAAAPAAPASVSAEAPAADLEPNPSYKSEVDAYMGLVATTEDQFALRKRVKEQDKVIAEVRPRSPVAFTIRKGVAHCQAGDGGRGWATLSAVGVDCRRSDEADRHGPGEGVGPTATRQGCWVSPTKHTTEQR